MRLPLLLWRAGATVDVLAPASSALHRSIYLRKRLKAASDEAVARTLRQHLATHRYDLVILGDEPTIDAVAELARADGRADWADPWFPVPDLGDGLDRIKSKASFVDAAQQFGVPIPASRVCRDAAEVCGALAVLGYPAILKAAVGYGGNGVAKVAAPAELPAALAVLGGRFPLVAQQFVEGRIGSTQMLFDRGRPVFWLPMYKKVCFPEPFGPSCVREFLDQTGIDAMGPIVENVGRMTRFHGFCGIDWIERGPGRFDVLEFNPRPVPAFHLGRHVGIDCSAALRGMLAGAPTSQTPRPATRGREIVYLFPQHFRRSIKKHEWHELRRYLMPGPTIDIPWREPVILVGTIVRLSKLVWRQFRGPTTAQAETRRPPAVVVVVRRAA